MGQFLVWRNCERARRAVGRATARLWSNVNLIPQPVKKDLETRLEVIHRPNSDAIEVGARPVSGCFTAEHLARPVAATNDENVGYQRASPRICAPREEIDRLQCRGRRDVRKKVLSGADAKRADDTYCRSNIRSNSAATSLPTTLCALRGLCGMKYSG